MPVNLEQMTPSDNYVTGAYCDGIKDARSFLDNNPDLTADDMQHMANQSIELMQKHSDAMKRFFMGQRDFWRNQIKKFA